MKEKIAGISLISNLILAVIKIAMGHVSNSVAVLSEGIHSGMDVISSGINLIGLKEANKPIDEKHPYGHYKFEVLSGLFITIILFITGIGIIYKALRGLLSPSGVKLGNYVLGVMFFSALINEVMARLKLYYGKRENSISLVSDGVHSRVDVWTSIAVFIGLILNKYWIYMDSLLAFLIGLYIIKKSISLGKEATDSLLDSSAGPENERKIREITEKNKITIVELKTQKKGSVITANIIIGLPQNLSVEEATLITEKLKEELIEKMKNLSYVAVQIEKNEYSTYYFKSREILGFGRGFGWQRKLRLNEENKETINNMPVDLCICNKCGYKEEHKRGVPCSSTKCPKCGNNLIRQI